MGKVVGGDVVAECRKREMAASLFFSDPALKSQPKAKRPVSSGRHDYKAELRTAKSGGIGPCISYT